MVAMNQMRQLLSSCDVLLSLNRLDLASLAQAMAAHREWVPNLPRALRSDSGALGWEATSRLLQGDP
ncbi:unnamed protein product, partial [Chrysoparadoxa australica]